MAVILFMVAGLAGLFGALIQWMVGSDLMVAFLTYMSVGCGLPLFVLLAIYLRDAGKPADFEHELAADIPENQ